MWRLLIVLAVFFGLMSRPVLAQSAVIAVAGGEHGAFTRLTLSGLPAESWDLVRRPDGYLLTPRRNDARFDLTRTFDKILRDRIADVTPTPDGLSIRLNCDCHIEHFQFRGTYLVLDVKPGAPPVETATLSFGVDPPAPLPDLIPFGTEGQSDSTPPVQAIPVPGLPGGADLAIGGTGRLTAALDAASKNSERIQQIEADLAESIARAATQGLLTPSGPMRGPQIANDAPPEADPPAPPSLLAAESQSVQGVGLSAQTSIDRDMHIRFGGEADPQGPDSRGAAPQCLPDSLFHLPELAEDASFDRLVADARVELTSELDRVPAGAAEDLARIYLAYGFGSEAILVLHVDGAMSQERRVLELMGAVVDERRLPYADLESQITCPGSGALWAFAASPSDQPVPGGDRAALLRAFQHLPPALQSILAPRLSERFLKLGDADSADAVLNRFQPASIDPTTEAGIAEAGLAGRIEGPEAEIEALAELARSDARATPQSLITLLELAREQGRTPDSDLIDLAAAFRFEYRDDPVAMDLAVAEARLLIDHDRFDEALALMSSTEPFPDPAMARQLLSEIVSAMTARADNQTFLAFALTRGASGLLPEVQNELAARMLALGLPEQAEMALISPASGATAVERRHLRAEAALALGKPDQALLILEDLDGDRAAALRAAALAQSGEAAAAYRAGESVGPSTGETEGDRQTAAWRAGAWADLAAAEDPVMQLAGAAMLTDAEPQPGTATLAAGQDALSASTRSRDLIDSLLSRFPTPAE